jgi:hypothetical protein
MMLVALFVLLLIITIFTMVIASSITKAMGRL